jgi:Rrf2 family transcriptional regulator, iron-sulfur cluster assembly transcription factor
MDLRLTRRGDYAVRAALSLAGAWREPDGQYLKTREIAAAVDVPLSYTPQVLKLLATAGLADAKAGRDGGYRLRRPPGEITLLAVVEAAEGGFELGRCILRGGPCHWRDACAVHAAWFGVVQACRAEMARTTLADLLAADAALRAGRPLPEGVRAPPGARPAHG